MKVLIVDEEPTDQLLCHLTLEPISTEIQKAASGLEGLAHARRQQPDVAVLDVLQPDLDGLAVYRQL